MENKDLQGHVVVPLPIPEPGAPHGAAPSAVASPQSAEVFARWRPTACARCHGGVQPSEATCSTCGLWQPAWCKRCARERGPEFAVVTPVEPGRCPQCASHIKGTRSNRKHPVRVDRRTVIREQLEAEFHPSTTMAKAACTSLASTIERLEIVQPGSAEWQRLVATAHALNEGLRASRIESRETDAALNFDHLPLADLAERASFVADRLLTLALAEKEGREEVAAAAEELRAQQVNAAVEEQVEAVSKGETPAPLPRWFGEWLAKQGQQS